MSSWLDALITGIKLVFDDGTEQPARAGINFIGATVVDNESENRIDVTVGSGLELSDDTPQPLGSASAGVAATASRSDHAHAHGVQAGGTTHAVATGATAGFMSAADKTAHDANTTAIGAATSAAAANTIARRGSSGECAFATVRGNGTTLDLSPDEFSFVTMSRSGGNNLEFDGGDQTNISNPDESIAITAPSLGLTATSGSVTITPGDECLIETQLVASTTLVVNAEGVSIGPSAVAPGATQNGAIQLSTAAPGGSAVPADIGKAWLWYDGANAIDSRRYHAENIRRLDLKAHGVTADADVAAANNVTAGLSVYTPEIRALTLDLDLRHEAGGKFDFKRGDTSYAQLTNDGAGTTTLEETGANALLVKSNGALNAKCGAGSKVNLAETGAASSVDVYDSGGVLVVDFNSATASLLNATNMLYRAAGYHQWEMPNGVVRMTIGGVAFLYRNEYTCGASADTTAPTGTHRHQWAGTGKLRYTDEAWGCLSSTTDTDQVVYTSQALPAGNTTVEAKVLLSTAAGATAGTYKVEAVFKSTGAASTHVGSTVTLIHSDLAVAPTITAVATGASNKFEIRVDPNTTTATGATASDVKITYGGP